MLNKKIRLVGGPFGGKVENHSGLYGQSEIILRGPKKMTRKQKYDYLRDNYDPYSMYPAGDGKMILPGARFPQVEARYRISYHPQDPRLLAMHPDGSIFYEYVEGSKREFS